MITIPNNNQWSQNNDGDIFGSLWSTNNINLNSKKGEIRISPRMLLNINSSDSEFLGVPCTFKYFRTPVGDLWTIAGSYIYKADGVQNTTFEVEDNLSAPTNGNSDYSDMEVFNASLYLTTASTSLYKISSSGAYSTLAGRLVDSSGLHDLEFFRATNRLYFVDDNSKSVGSIDTADTAATLGNQYTLNDLVNGNSQVISWIKSTSNRIYIGTINYTGTDGYVFGWDGSQITPNESYRLNSAGSLACVIKNDTPHIIDTNGRLLVLNGATFTGTDGNDYLARLPVDEKILGAYFGPATGRFIHYNGMCLNDRGRIQLLINAAPWTTGFPSSELDENCPSGVWEYDPSLGLYHKNSPGYAKAGESITDYGQKKISAVGALSYISLPDNGLTAGSINGTYIAGLKYFTNATSTLNGIFYDDSNDTLQKAGYFVTPKIYSSNVEDYFNYVYARFKKFANGTDKLVVKVRTEEIESVEATVNWLGSSNDVFSTSTDLSAFAKGDEVEILQGKWAGAISTISEIDGAYTVKLEDTFSGVTTTTGVVRLQKWKTIGTYTSTTDKSKKMTISNSASTWVQLKFYVVVTGKWDFHDILLINKGQNLLN